jgi:hypothetical protein
VGRKGHYLRFDTDDKQAIKIAIDTMRKYQKYGRLYKMKMTIDDARTALEKERKYALHENKQAFNVAISIMRKYQHIEQIVNDRYGKPTFIDAIIKVVEDDINN